MRIRAVALLLGIAVFGAGVACEPQQPLLLDQEGDPCKTLHRFCVDAERAMHCVDERWTAVTCESFCAAEAPGVRSAGCDEIDCECMPPEGGCIPDERFCADEDIISWCTESWTWASRSCEELCAEAGPGLLSEGCVAEEAEAWLGSMPPETHCLCSAEGTACAPDEAPFCADDLRLATCVGGLWAYHSCAEACDGVGRCQPLGEGVGCACEPM